MARRLAVLVALASLAPAAAADMRGDDWDGTFALAVAGKAYVYAFEGRGCGFPMWCWSLAERFFVGDEAGLVEVPGEAAWMAWSTGALGSYARFRGAFTFGGEALDVSWFAAVHSICQGLYEGPVVMGDFLDPLTAGRGSAAKVGPGPDGGYECMPS